MEGLGRVLDVAAGVINVDVQAAAATGGRVRLARSSGLTIMVLAGFTGAVDPLNITLRQHNAAVAGTSQDLAIIDHYYLKTAAALTSAATWTRVTQTKAATLAAFGTAAEQKLLAVEVDGAQLADGFGWVSLDIPDQGAQLGTKVTSVLYLLRDLTVQRAPANLANPAA